MMNHQHHDTRMALPPDDFRGGPAQQPMFRVNYGASAKFTMLFWMLAWLLPSVPGMATLGLAAAYYFAPGWTTAMIGRLLIWAGVSLKDVLLGMGVMV